jgi:ribosomal protein L29
MKTRALLDPKITRTKLADLEAHYTRTRDDATLAKHVRELTLHSLKRLINQLKEELVRHEAAEKAGATSTATHQSRN